MMIGNGKTNAAYNIQTAVDSKHKLIIAYEVTNDINDRYQLTSMAQLAKNSLGVDTLAVVADKGYVTGTELHQCEQLGITTYVPFTQATERRRSNVPTPEYYHANFQYNKEHDCYICPQQQELKRRYTVWVQRQLKTVYASSACQLCSVKSQCSTNIQGRRIYRTQHEELMQSLRRRNQQNPEILKERKCLSEHPFGTIKHAWNQGYLLLRGFEKVRAEISLSVLAYNIRRAITILGVSNLIRTLEIV
jgi:hypothetical protein